MRTSLRQQVWDRAQGCCEYCQLPQTAVTTPHHLDHIRPGRHGGATLLVNLALACFMCNSFKGSNATGYDPRTDEITPLFNPRTQPWHAHFSWDGPTLVGKTPMARTTIEVLRINLLDRIRQRQFLMQAGMFPPSLSL